MGILSSINSVSVPIDFCLDELFSMSLQAKGMLYHIRKISKKLDFMSYLVLISVCPINLLLFPSKSLMKIIPFVAHLFSKKDALRL